MIIFTEYYSVIWFTIFDPKPWFFFFNSGHRIQYINCVKGQQLMELMRLLSNEPINLSILVTRRPVYQIY